MEYPRVDWSRTITTTLDISGSPTMIVGPDDSVFFAVSASGTVSGGTLALPDVTTLGIYVGAMDKSGSLQWLLRDSRLFSNANDTAPSLVLGSAGELYLAFVTPGAVPSRSNCADVPSLCGSCGATAGRDDIVLARIDGAVSGSPTIAWVVQDAYLNSCSNENRVRLHYDTAQNRLFIAYQTGGATLCNNRIGTPNIVLVCFNTAGYLTWSYQAELLNGAGANEAPCVATDASGGVYIAYTITAPVSGGAASLTGTKDVEVIKLHIEGELVRVVRDWILSGATTPINSAGVNTDPYIVCDPTRNALYLAFTATEAVPGGTKTATGSDIVFAAINTTNGALTWIVQGPEWNEVTYRYNSVDTPSLALNQYGSLYATAHAYDTGGNAMILVWNINPTTAISSWYFRTDISSVYRAYVLAAAFTAPFMAVEAAAPFSAAALAVYAGHIYLTFNRRDTGTQYVVGLNETINYLEYNAQQYIRNVTSICSSVRKL
jgi:hypothetical protein